MRVDSARTSSVQSKEGSSAESAKKSGRAALIEEGKKSRDAAAAKNAAASGAVKSDISPKARELSTAKAVASEAPDVRESRVAELKKRISDGSYSVDAKAVADRLVDDHLSASLD